jgi:hypothetical protein
MSRQPFHEPRNRPPLTQRTAAIAKARPAPSLVLVDLLAFGVILALMRFLA